MSGANRRQLIGGNMNTQIRVLPHAVLVSLCIGLAVNLPADESASRHYLKTELVSDVSGRTAVTDANLVNPWGLVSSATSPWWVADNGTGRSTLYNGTGTAQALVVTVPNVAGSTDASAPTGIVFNGVATDFLVAAGQPARFLFATEGGTIVGWNSGPNAVQVVDNSAAAVYKGLTLTANNGANLLYAANFKAGTVDVFDNAFHPVTLAAGAFQDPEVPADYAPFNVQVVGDVIYVAFAQREAGSIDEVHGAGKGRVDVFTPAGVLLRHLRWGPWFNAPWGVVQAPAGFGRFSNAILVGQFGSGKIVAFDPDNGEFRGILREAHGRPVIIDGLWALRFGNGASAGPATTLFFTAGIEDEAHGLFGTITSVAGNGHDGDDEGDNHDGD
jgi:uncharacterized protein (TIGR03118 family)